MVCARLLKLSALFQAAPNSLIPVPSSSITPPLLDVSSSSAADATSGTSVPNASQLESQHPQNVAAASPSPEAQQLQPVQSGHSPNSPDDNMLGSQVSVAAADDVMTIRQEEGDCGAGHQDNGEAAGKLARPSVPLSGLGSLIRLVKRFHRQPDDSRADTTSLRSYKYVDSSAFGTEQDIRDVLSGLGQDLHAQHVAMGFDACRRMATRPSHQLLDWLTGLVVARVGSLQDRNIANILFACAKCGYVNPVLGQALGEKLLTSARTAGLTNFNLSNIIHSLAILQREHTKRCGLSLWLVKKSLSFVSYRVSINCLTPSTTGH